MLVDVIATLSSISALNGLVFAAPLLLAWIRSKEFDRVAAQKLLITTLVATLLGACCSLMAQQVWRWPPPSGAPETAQLFAEVFRGNPNQNSFPSDSTMLYSAVAFGVLMWNRLAGAFLFAWLFLFIAPIRILVGGHYPSDILAGLVIGGASFLLSYLALNKNSFVRRLSVSSSPALSVFLLIWLFEVGVEFGDVRRLANALWHLRHHL